MNEMCEINYFEHGENEVPYNDNIIHDGDLVHEALFETIDRVVDYAGRDLCAIYDHLLGLFSQTLQVYYGECQIVPRDIPGSVQLLKRATAGEISL